MPHTVTDNRARKRFELDGTGGEAFVDYRRDGEILRLTYALVPAQLRGRGIGAALVDGTLRLVQARGEQIIAQCSFVAAYIRALPEFQGLLATHPPPKSI